MGGEWGVDRVQMRDAVGGGFDKLEERLRVFDSRLRALETGAFSENVAFGPNGIRIKGGAGLRIDDGGAAQSGDFAAGETGWQLKDDSAEFNNLTLRGGIIGNDALTSPSKPGSIYAAATNFALTTTLTNILTVTVTVPDGFTIAHVTSVIGRVFAFNNTGGLDYLYGETNIAGFNGYALPLAVSGSGGSGTNVSTFTTTLTGLTPGSTFPVQVAAMTSFAPWAANTGNTVEVSGSVTWYR